MTHITLSKKTKSEPSLEFYSDDGVPHRVAIDHFPFRIGRAESADLRVEAVEVSREHAEIVERNGVWLVRDLGSTNGTQVNGTSIKETLLADRDIVKVAESELTFVASAASQFQRMVTQPIQSKKPVTASNGLPPEIAAARMLTEATLWQALSTQLFAIKSLRHGVTEALMASSHSSSMRLPQFDQPHPVSERYHELERMWAVERAIEGGAAKRLFLAVGAAEIETPRQLFSSVKPLQEQLPGGWELGITISIPLDVEILRITNIYREARDYGLLVAYDEFHGNGGQVMHLQSLPPDYLVLSENMIKDLTSTRQPLRRLESLLAACADLVIKAVLPRNDLGPSLVLCQEMGFDLKLHLATRRAAVPRADVRLTV